MIEHDLANGLLDLAEAGDRAGYKQERGRVRREHPVQAQSAEALVKMQVQMWRDRRIFGWRSVWVSRRGR